MARIASQLLILSAVILALSLLIRKVLLDASDPYRCHSLRDGGRWLKRARDQDGSVEPHDWQPPGCILHEYNAREIEECLECGRILFAGDSNVRQLFWATAMHVNKTQAEHTRLYTEKHADLLFGFGCSTLQFLWDPYLNSSALHDEIVASGSSHHNEFSLRNTSQTSIVAGGGLWHARYLGDDYQMAFQRNIDTLVNLSRNTDTVKPTTLLENQRNLLLFTPVLSPDYDMLDEDRDRTLTRDRLSTLNIHLLQTKFKNQIEILWSFSSMLQPHILAHGEDGIHLLMEIVDKQADIILNLRCNAVTALQHYPFDKTCCTDMLPYNMVQAIMLMLALSAVVLGVVTNVSTMSGLRSPKPQRQERINALIILSFACMYCYLADRTHLFEKMQKTTDQETFLWMFGFIIVLGVLTIGRSTIANHNYQTVPGSYASCSYLSRDQTEEWKGWMQFAVLLYHYFGMSRVLWIYQLVRLMVASYLFMTGFGHALFFLKTNDFSLRRVAAVLIRLNILSVVLAYGMRTDYSFYYFPALSSFWFLIVYLTMRSWGWRKARGLQMGISGILVMLALQHPGFLEKIVETLHATCRMHIDVHELRFRISLDVQVVYFGMLFAIGYVEFTHAQPVYPLLFTERRKQIAQLIAVLAASATVVSYGIFASQFTDKYTYNKWHTVLSPFPILAFVVLRNATPLFRAHHSWLFALLGRCSLETFILQYHIWLAADTKGLLRLGLCNDESLGGPCGRWCRWFEFWIITVFFLWTSWEVSRAINVLTGWVVGPARLEPVLGEVAEKNEGRDASIFTKANQKLGLKFRLATILAVLFIGNWMWK